ncbi:MAG: rane protein [Verrucomicrobiales bacterium]|nr:rane protein [Verrucomicrobiales bacterium]
MKCDVIVIGAGGAGMMCALQAGMRGRKVILLDHAPKLGGKILISGGGRCNFTNTGASPAQYVSANAHFCKSALSRYTPADFIALVGSHGIAYHEKKLGQLFCDVSARQIVEMLKSECAKVGAEFKLNCKIESVAKNSDLGAGRFQLSTSQGDFFCESLVIATGGLSIPKIGATGFGYEIARQFGLRIVDTAPALDGFVFSDKETQSLSELAGLSVDCVITCNHVSFRENILFTHNGLSGPAALQASLHWRPGIEVSINLLPEIDPTKWLLGKKRTGERALVKNLLSQLLPNRFAARFCELNFRSELPLAQIPDKEIEEFGRQLSAWRLVPSGTVGYNKAEVTRGGVDTRELSSRTMEAIKVPGLYFIGEVVDVTGWLGGYNFQWAWASGAAAGGVV